MRQTLAEKQQLVADILQIPRDDFEHIADMAAETGGEKDARELILNSILSGGWSGELGGNSEWCGKLG